MSASDSKKQDEIIPDHNFRPNISKSSSKNEPFDTSIKLDDTANEEAPQPTLSLAERVKCRRRESVLLAEAEQVGHERLHRHDPQLLLAVQRLRLRHERERAGQRVNYGKQLWRTLRCLVMARAVTMKAASGALPNNTSLPPLNEGTRDETKSDEDKLQQRSIRHGTESNVSHKTEQKRTSPDSNAALHKRGTEVKTYKRIKKETNREELSKMSVKYNKHETPANRRLLQTDRSTTTKSETINDEKKLSKKKKDQKLVTTTKLEPSVNNTKTSSQPRKERRTHKPGLLPPLHATSNTRAHRMTQPDLHELSLALDKATMLPSSGDSSEPIVRPAASSRHRVWSFNWVPTMHHPGRLPSFYRQLEKLQSAGRRDVRSATSERAERRKHLNNPPESISSRK